MSELFLASFKTNSGNLMLRHKFIKKKLLAETFLVTMVLILVLIYYGTRVRELTFSRCEKSLTPQNSFSFKNMKACQTVTKVQAVVVCNYYDKYHFLDY